MTEKELSELYMRLALQFDSVLGTLVSKNLVFPDFVPGDVYKRQVGKIRSFLLT